ncbi:hypothetical protein QI045_12570 [Staphylococcus saprophyticus]|nr:hypothetical protein [Staphylococcus saprophyticus]
MSEKKEQYSKNAYQELENKEVLLSYISGGSIWCKILKPYTYEILVQHEKKVKVNGEDVYYLAKSVISKSNIKSVTELIKKIEK